MDRVRSAFAAAGIGTFLLRLPSADLPCQTHRMRHGIHPKAKPLLLGAAVVGVLTVAAWLSFVGLPPSIALSVAELNSYNRLVSAEYFAGPAVGIAGSEPDESKALRLLAVRSRGGTAFKYLLIRGTPAGRLYALVGLRHTNPLFFRIVVQPFRIWPGDVQTIFGCVGESVEIRELVSTRRENPVRLKPGETLAGWWQRREPGVEVNVDIVGGGYTSMFLDFDELTRPAASREQPAVRQSTNLNQYKTVSRP